MSNYKKIINKLINLIFILIGAIFIKYYIDLKNAYGYISFSKVFFIVGILMVTYGLLTLIFKIDFWNKIPIIGKRIILVVFLIGITFFSIIEGIIYYEGHHYDTEKPDYIMVLGAGIKGREISTSLLYRLDKALEFNKKYPDVKIIVSGGQGEREEITEAEAMKNYLVSKGINEDLIIKEEKSTSTYENFVFTKKILENITGKTNFKITVITNNFHMYRAKFLGKEAGFKCLGYPAPSHKDSSFNFHVREFFGVIKAYILKK